MTTLLENYNFRTLPAHWSSHHTTYWQHGDHLGSASWVTDTNGTACQHLQYMPWGEPLVDLRSSSSSYDTRYTFSGKERDEETGFSYFGSRYYNSSLSIWLSVDPMAGKYPSLSPYAYCANNPVRIQDPNGEDIWEINESGYARWVDGSTTEHKIFLTKGKKDDEFGERITTGIGENKQEVCINHKKVDEFMKNFHPDSEDKGHWGALMNNEDNRDFAKQFMKEVSQHTEVEWGYTGSKEGLLYISTTNEKGRDDCSGRIVRQLVKNENLLFAYHVQHDYCFGSNDDYKNIENLGFPDATFGIIYQRQLYNFKGFKIDWP